MRSFAIEDPGSPDPPLYATLGGAPYAPRALAQADSGVTTLAIVVS